MLWLTSAAGHSSMMGIVADFYLQRCRLFPLFFFFGISLQHFVCHHHFADAQQQQQPLSQRYFHPIGNISSIVPPSPVRPFAVSAHLQPAPLSSYHQSVPIYLSFPFPAAGGSQAVAAAGGHFYAAITHNNQQQQQRINYVPCINRCSLQNQQQQNFYRYRWVTMANSSSSSGASAASTGVQRPSQPWPWHATTFAPDVQQPNAFRGTFVQVIFPQHSLTTTTTTSPKATTATTVKESEENEPEKAEGTRRTTGFSPTTTAAPPTMAQTELIWRRSTTLVPTTTTTVQLTTTTTTSGHYELPTPPPYSPEQNIATVGELIVRLNPCPHGQPLVNEFRNPITCNFVVQPNGACPADYWCHTGASYETTTCCPVGHLKDRCQLPRANGEGDALIPRWYFDSGDRKCKRFLYTGMRGNANNFVTVMECMESCETAANAAVVHNPCASGPPARDLNGEQFLCATADARCPAGYYCHLGDNPLTNVCCELSAAVSDRCHLALRPGDGAARLRRFYFNTVTRRCVQFVYRGAKGNENQFISLTDCRKECERPPNPCPAMFDFGVRRECRSDGDGCARGEWCHLGSGRETTVCCPGASDDPCKLPLDLGQGTENLTRWYAVPAEDACQRECRPFQYKGMKGNQNNFQLKASCEATCKADCPFTLNPCGADEEPLLDPEGRPQRCNGTGSQCPADYWCHVGANAETTVCCSSGDNRVCALPLAEGVGSALLSRWYFDAKDGNCHRFIYKGIGGNQNNYVDYEQCMNACPDDSTSPAPPSSSPPLSPAAPHPLVNPCGIGTPLTDNGGGTVRECSPNSRCPVSHFCHISGNSLKVPNVCCPKNGDPCEQPLAEGSGPFKLTRYHFDTFSRRCHSFIYRGARGNANNFLSAEDCELVCQVMPPTRVNPCPNGTPLVDDQNEPLVCGNSLAAADLAMFGPLTAAHQHQLYTGCPSGFWCHVGSSPDTTNCCPQLTDGGKRSCDLPLEYGTGEQKLDRWYFDANSQQCLQFVYTGLKGNANNFVSREHCKQACPELTNFSTGTGGQQQQQQLGNSLLPSLTRTTGVGVVDESQQMPPSLSSTWSSSTIKTSSTTGDDETGDATPSLPPPNPASLHLPNPCLHGELLRDGTGTVMKCHPNEEEEEEAVTWAAVGCPVDTHFCHVGHHLNQTGCCPRTTAATGSAAVAELCQLPASRGVGTVAHIRWHFNADAQRCEAFDYGGTKGNENNFVTKRQCEERCLERRRGITSAIQFCPHGEPKWEKNATSSGSSNRMGHSSSRGMRRRRPMACGPTKGCPEGYLCHVNSQNGMAVCCENPAHFCLLTREHGPCDGQKVRYGYNPLTDTCVPYRYGGCGGTLNNFDSIDRCMEICCRQYQRRN